jgi:hypothetical protein
MRAPVPGELPGTRPPASRVSLIACRLPPPIKPAALTAGAPGHSGPGCFQPGGLCRYRPLVKPLPSAGSVPNATPAGSLAAGRCHASARCGWHTQYGAEAKDRHGHLLTADGRCHYEKRRTTFYEPPHDIRHRQAETPANSRERYAAGQANKSGGRPPYALASGRRGQRQRGERGWEGPSRALYLGRDGDGRSGSCGHCAVVDAA